MSYAIYGESDAYVHLVTGETPSHVLSEFMSDLASVGVKLGQVYNVYAVNGREEAVDVEDTLNNLIKEAQ